MRAIAPTALALLAACQQAPRVGAPAGAPPPKGPSVELVAAELDGARHVVATFQAARDGKPLDEESARALAPAWTLAALGKEPVSGLPAWRSLVLTGAETLASLPVAGPGTPDAQVLLGTPQPGAETGGAWASKGGGTFTYTFTAPLAPEQDPSETLRVGVFLRGVAGTALTTSTLDFVPNHGPLAGRELVVDAACAVCHGTLRAHDGSRTGTKICVTCHTWQHADAETVDPAAPVAAKPDTNPNPLELGRLVHRIHRGKNLPTLYVASSSAAAAQPYGDVAPAAPFRAGAGTLPADPAKVLNADPAWVGRRYSVVGERSRERVFGEIASRTDNGQPARILAAGVTFPRDYRSCDACHTRDAAQVVAIDVEISRRTCAGCHPDVWFASATPPDGSHLAHPGGPLADDTTCVDCHVTPGAKLRVPIKEAHVVPFQSARYSKPVVEIVSVTNLKPGLAPTIVFKVSDRDGPLRDLVAPAPPESPVQPASPLPRGITRLSISVAGPASPDFRTLGAATLPLTETVVDATKTPPTSDAEGRFTYTFPDTKRIPEGMDGTWIVWIDARRYATVPVFDAAKGFQWPYTGESVSELADNAVVWVDTASGALGQGDPVPRRKIVDVASCNKCHLRLTGHGSRTRVELCVVCHAPDKTDWGRRPKDVPGNTALAMTYDGVEERSLQLKRLVHRIHTGGRSGPAELAKPLVSYAGPRFRDMGEFPNDLGRCTLCHVEGTYRVEAVPADATATTANETPTVLHAATTAHSPDEAPLLPIAAACTGCHGTAYSAFHVARYTSDGKEQCVSCHGLKGAQGVDKVHGLPSPVPQ